MPGVTLYWCFFLLITLMTVNARRYYNDDDRIVFPGQIRDRRMSTNRPVRFPPSSAHSCSDFGCSRRRGNVTELPISLVRELNQVTDLQDISHLITNKEEFLRSIQREGEPGVGVRLTSRFGSDESVLKSPTYTKLPDCTPQPMLIPLQSEELQTNALLYPSCIRVDRCSGCCNHPSLECNAVNTEKHSYKVSVMQLDNDNGKPSFKFKETKIFEIEKHTKCSCSCKTKLMDCNSKQIYRQEKCLCECANMKEMRSCFRYEDRYWDDDTCSCVCLEPSECSTGTYFNTNSCRCVKEDFN